jgi:DNA polymerase (family X)
VGPPLPRNDEIAAQLDLLADLLDLDGEASFRVVAYRRAATRIRDTPGSVAQLALEGRAKDLPGIGKIIEEKIVQFIDDGEMEALAKRRELVPEGVVEFLRLPGLGPKTARRIWQELGITTVEELRAAAEQQRLRGLTGLGAKTEENLLRALSEPREQAGGTLLGRALPALQAVVAVLAEHPSADKVSEAGSARRRKETVRDLDIIATASDPAALTEYLTKLNWVQEVAAQGPTKATVVSNDGLRFDLRVVPPESYGNLLQHFTGSKHHNVALREDAVRRGFSVSEYGVQEVATGEVVTSAREEELYERLGYQFIPPELREGGRELERARCGEIPRLVELRDLRGDLHCHTDWSADGKNSLEEMARAARARGYDYLAITDHAHYMRDGRLQRQWELVDALNRELAPFRLLKGVEANIRQDGSVDVSDEDLRACDWVMASVHAGLAGDITDRVLAAMDNPSVACIGHLTGRRIGVRRPADVNLERVVEHALATRTSLEINSQPDRLDLRDRDAEFVGDSGVLIAVSSDAHRVDTLAYTEVGVGQARRAWLTREQILNTRPWADIAALRRG